jgi:hypothetical protein
MLVQGPFPLHAMHLQLGLLQVMCEQETHSQPTIEQIPVPSQEGHMQLGLKHCCKPDIDREQKFWHEMQPQLGLMQGPFPLHAVHLHLVFVHCFCPIIEQLTQSTQLQLVLLHFPNPWHELQLQD